MNEYYLGFWGQIRNDDQRWIERDLGVVGTDFWFPTAEERAAFKAKLKACADGHNCLIAFAEREGDDVRFRTVVKVALRVPGMSAATIEHDFGYAYPVDAAEFMFIEGNYSCDCNKAMFLREAGYDVAEMECGDKITIESLVVERTYQSEVKK